MCPDKRDKQHMDITITAVSLSTLTALQPNRSWKQTIKVIMLIHANSAKSMTYREVEWNKAMRPSEPYPFYVSRNSMWGSPRIGDPGARDPIDGWNINEGTHWMGKAWWAVTWGTPWVCEAHGCASRRGRQCDEVTITRFVGLFWLSRQRAWLFGVAVRAPV